MIRADQIRASLIGGSLGDAWGGPYEGRPGPLAAPFPDVGQLSDDTYLTIATCEAIAMLAVLSRREPSPTVSNVGSTQAGCPGWGRQR